MMKLTFSSNRFLTKIRFDYFQNSFIRKSGEQGKIRYIGFNANRTAKVIGALNTKVFNGPS